MRDAVKLAQTMLAAAGQNVRVDGLWGAESESGWNLTSEAVRSAIRESVLRNESVSMEAVRSSRKNRPQTASREARRSEPQRRTENGTMESATRELGDDPSPGQMKEVARRVLTSLGYSASDFAAISRQVEKESGWRWDAKENHMYVTNRPKIGAFASWTMDEIRSLVRKGKEAFFEAAYGFKTRKGKELGNTEPGDGGKFLGRGLLQETGRANFARLSEMLGVDLISDPDWVIARPSNQLRAFVATVQKRFGARKGKLTDRDVLANINPGIARG